MFRIDQWRPLLLLVKKSRLWCLRYRVHLSVSSRLGACGVFMVKILNKCILSILVYNLFYRQTAQYFHTLVYWLSSWNKNSNFQRKLLSDWLKNRLDTKWESNLNYMSNMLITDLPNRMCVCVNYIITTSFVSPISVADVFLCGVCQKRWPIRCKGDWETKDRRCRARSTAVQSKL